MTAVAPEFSFPGFPAKPFLPNPMVPLPFLCLPLGTVSAPTHFGLAGRQHHVSSQAALGGCVLP